MCSKFDVALLKLTLAEFSLTYSYQFSLRLWSLIPWLRASVSFDLNSDTAIFCLKITISVRYKEGGHVTHYRSAEEKMVSLQGNLM